MGAIASQITSLTIVFSTVYLDTDQRKHHSSASLAFVRGIHRRPVNSPHKRPVTQKVFPFDDVIMVSGRSTFQPFSCWIYFRALNLTLHFHHFLSTDAGSSNRSSWKAIQLNPSLLNMMTSSNGNIFRVTGHLCEEFPGHRWIPRTKASNAELWCFLWSASDQTVE